MKKLISFFLIICTILSMCAISVSAATVTGSQIAAEAKKYEGKVKYVTGGSSLTNGADCSGFIYRIHKNLGVSGITLDGMRSVRKASFCKKYSSNVADAKPGMILLCNTNSHVMLYLGNNKAIHLPQPGQYCKISDVKYFSFSGPYDGAYTVDGVSYDGVSTGGTTKTNGPTKKPTISVTSYPTTINEGSSYGLRGSINANGGSTDVMGYILNSKGKTVQSTKLEKTSSSSFDIRYSNVNEQLSFNKLSAGKYTLKITAKNSKGTSTYTKGFTVKAKQTVKKPTINITSYPTSINKGKSYGLRGSINANGGSTEVMGYILNSKGKTVQSTKLEKTSSSSFDIRYSNVNEQLLFNKLSKGTYTLKITAKNSAGTSTFSKQFKVK